MTGSETPRRASIPGTFLLSLVAVLLAFAALFVAAEAYSHADDAKSVAAKAGTGAAPSSTDVHLEEFSITAHPGVVKAGTVTMRVDNVGAVTHEMVLVRAPSVDALPRVTTATKDRAVGDVDEEAIPEADKMGETGDVKPGQHVTKTFHLTPGTYVMFCNIDDPGPNGTVVNHFQHGMHALIVAV